MTFRAIVFDFDGTLVESNQTKTQGFRALFQEYPEQVEEIVALHLRHGGRSRFEKFAMIYRDILHRVPQPGEFDELGERFGQLVADAVIACPMVEGASSFLERFSGKLPLIVVSATPGPELERILESRGLSRYFAEVHGSPRTKDVIVRGVLERYGWRPDQVLFVGDMPADYEAAVAAGVPFVGRVPSGTPSCFPATTRTITDLNELSSVVVPDGTAEVIR